MKPEKGTPEYEQFRAHRREYMRARRAAMSPEQLEAERAACRAWHSKNREAAIERMRQWRLKNSGAAAESSRAWREANPGRQAELNRAWKEANAEAYLSYVQRTRAAKNAKSREWNKRNRDRTRIYAANRRARIEEAGGTHTRHDIAQLLLLQRRRCAICRERLDSAYEVDHIVPIAGGGHNGKTNLQLLCPLCNRTKGAKDPIAFMQSKGFLL